MGIHGKTQGTPLEKTIGQLATGEALGGMLYYALARVAAHHGYGDVAKAFEAIGNQETNHAGFYATLNGKYPLDKGAFWKLVKGLSRAEAKGEEGLGQLARQLADLGLAEAAAEVKEFAAQEKSHGETTKALLEKFAPEYARPVPEGQKRYVCPVCGFEYEGDIDAEGPDYQCPVCGVRKAGFKPLD